MHRTNQFEDPLLSPRSGQAILVALGIFLTLTQGVQGQLFNGGGLFNKKTEAPKAQSEDAIGVPVPVTGRVEALKGHEVQFEIRSEAKTPGATVEFLIRTFPSAGKIVSLVSKPYERNKAIVTYYADPASSATADAFAFAVRYRGGRYSSEMRYDIDLVDLKTEIQVPAEVDFGEVMVGSEEVREITVRNIGNGSMERQIFLASPWHLLEPADGKLNLGPRGARVLKVAFRPELMGDTSYFLSFTRSKEGTTKLLGKGGEPFTLASEELELTLDAASGERSGEAEVVNPGGKPLLIKTRASTRIQKGILEGYLLAPGTTTKIPVKIGKTDTAPFDGTIQFFLENGYSKSVRVIAAVVPGKIVVSVPNSFSAELINFEKVEAGRSSERGMTLTNPGGVAVPIEFHLPEPFRLLTNPGPQLAPRSSVSISVGLFPTATARGLVDVTMNVYGNEQTVPIRLLGNVVAPSGASSRRGAPTVAPNLPSKMMRLGSGGGKVNEPVTAVMGTPSIPVAQKPLPTKSSNGNGDDEELWYSDLNGDEIKASRSPLGFVSREIMGRKLDPDLRRPEDLAVIKSGSDFIEIGWTAPKDTGPCYFTVEMRGLLVSEESGLPESVWVPYPVAEVDSIDRLIKAKITRLAPVSSYEFRVITATEDGRSSLPSEALTAETTLPMDWTYIYLIGGFIFVILLGLGIWKVVLDRRPEVYQSQHVEA